MSILNMSNNTISKYIKYYLCFHLQVSYGEMIGCDNDGVSSSNISYKVQKYMIDYAILLILSSCSHKCVLAVNTSAYTFPLTVSISYLLVRNRVVPFPMCQFNLETQRTMVRKMLIVTGFESVYENIFRLLFYLFFRYCPKCSQERQRKKSDKNDKSDKSEK